MKNSKHAVLSNATMLNAAVNNVSESTRIELIIICTCTKIGFHSNGTSFLPFAFVSLDIFLASSNLIVYGSTDIHYSRALTKLYIRFCTVI